MIQNKILKGFTMVELLVTMGIFMLVTAVVLANYKTYGNNAYFANASEDIVLALRQAQVYGAGSKGESGSFTSAYGVYFTTSNQIVVFRDNNDDNKYTVGTDSIMETIIWKSPIGITGACTPTCTAPISVTFKRPSPDAIIRDASIATVYTSATITVSNGLTPVKTSIVTINSSGQISLK